MQTALGIDAGGSSTRWLLLGATEGEPLQLGAGRDAGITGHLFEAGTQTLSTEGRESLQRLDGILDAVLQVAAPSAVVLGAASLSEGSPAALYLAEAIRQRLGLAEPAVRVVDDMQIAYAAVFAPGEGVLVYGGTGSIAYHIAADGSILRAGGHGYLINDAGGGFWIGKAALAQVLRWQDELGRPSEELLAREIYQQLGTSDWPAIRENIYRLGRSRVAEMTLAVGAAAAQGDAAAVAILQQAARELARLARVLLVRTGRKLPVALVGGITQLPVPVLLAAFKAELPDASAVSSNQVEPVQGAAQLALNLTV